MTDTPSLSIETITPENAAQMLALNTNNRVLRPQVVERYAVEMSAGRWLVTGEPIIISGTQLLNGQHRLHACVLAATPFTTAVFRGASSDVYAVVDSGVKRSPGDALGHLGVPNRNGVAAAARLVIGHRHDAFRDTTRLTQLSSSQRIVEEVMTDLDRYIAAANAGNRARRDGAFNGAATAAMSVILGRLAGQEICDEWMARAIDGVELEAGDPRLALRKWVLSSRGGGPVHLSAWIRARNAHVNNESRSQIKPWFKGQPFPVLIEKGSAS